MKQYTVKINDSLGFAGIQLTEGDKFDGELVSNEITEKLTGFSLTQLIAECSNVFEEHPAFDVLNEKSEKEYEFKSNGYVHAYKFFITLE